MIFYFRKIIFVEIKYSIHDQKLLIVVENFKQWRHYLKNNQFTIIVISNHNNLRYFMFIILLNKRQIRWTLLLKKYDFEIKYKNENLNFVDESSRRFDYENENDENDICLSTFQNKLRNIIIANIDFSTNFDKCEKISDNELTKKNSKNFIIVIKQMMRCEKIAKTCNKKNSYEDSFQKFFNKIEKLQMFDVECIKHRVAIKNNKESKSWTINSNNILRYWHAIYVSNEINLKTKILKRCHDDFLTRHFETKKRLILFNANFIECTYKRILKNISKNARSINEQKLIIIVFMTNFSNCRFQQNREKKSR